MQDQNDFSVSAFILAVTNDFFDAVLDNYVSGLYLNYNAVERKFLTNRLMSQILYEKSSFW